HGHTLVVVLCFLPGLCDFGGEDHAHPCGLPDRACRDRLPTIREVACSSFGAFLRCPHLISSGHQRILSESSRDTSVSGFHVTELGRPWVAWRASWSLPGAARASGRTRVSGYHGGSCLYGAY